MTMVYCLLTNLAISKTYSVITEDWDSWPEHWPSYFFLASLSVRVI